MNDNREQPSDEGSGPTGTEPPEVPLEGLEPDEDVPPRPEEDVADAQR